MTRLAWPALNARCTAGNSNSIRASQLAWFFAMLCSCTTWNLRTAIWRKWIKMNQNAIRLAFHLAWTKKLNRTDLEEEVGGTTKTFRNVDCLRHCQQRERSQVLTTQRSCFHGTISNVQFVGLNSKIWYVMCMYIYIYLASRLFVCLGSGLKVTLYNIYTYIYTGSLSLNGPWITLKKMSHRVTHHPDSLGRICKCKWPYCQDPLELLHCIRLQAPVLWIRNWVKAHQPVSLQPRTRDSCLSSALVLMTTEGTLSM